jgi:hypothetical protein
MTLFDVGNTGRMAAIYNFRREYEKAQDKSDTGKRCDPPQPHIAKGGGGTRYHGAGRRSHGGTDDRTLHLANSTNRPVRWIC